MKSISGFIFLVIMFYQPFTLSAESSGSSNSFPYTVSVGVSAGVLAGQAEEIVYASPAGGVYLSQLLWDMKPLVYAGISADFSRKNPLEKWGFFAGVSVKFGIPMRTGIMEDRDWQIVNHLTNFSSHDNNTQSAILADSAVGFSVPIASLVVFKAGIAFSYMYFSWASADGYIEYEYNGWERIAFSGPAINYAQQWFILSPGIGVWVPFLRFFSAEIGFRISPLVWCYAEDQHVGRTGGTDYYNDSVFGGIFLEPAGAVAFSPTPRLKITLSAGWRYINGPRGSTNAELWSNAGNGRTESYENSAGAGYSALDIGLSATLRF